MFVNPPGAAVSAFDERTLEILEREAVQVPDEQRVASSTYPARRSGRLLRSCALSLPVASRHGSRALVEFGLPGHAARLAGPRSSACTTATSSWRITHADDFTRVSSRRWAFIFGLATVSDERYEGAVLLGSGILPSRPVMPLPGSRGGPRLRPTPSSSAPATSASRRAQAAPAPGIRHQLVGFIDDEPKARRPDLAISRFSEHTTSCPTSSAPWAWSA
jgi:hypothetical protein